MQSDTYTGRVALIIGGAGTLGALLAARLTMLGVRVMLADVQEQPLHALAQDLRAGGADVAARLCDVTWEDDVRALVADTLEVWGRLDLAVNCAGTTTRIRRVVDLEEAEFDRVFAVSVKGVLFGMKYQIPAMSSSGEGVIVNVASLAGLSGFPNLGADAAAHHAIVGLTRTAAIEAAPDNVRINAICPSCMASSVTGEKAVARLGDRVASGAPMRRLGRPEEVVEAILMLCAPGNSYITGQAIAVDGGISAS